MKRIHLYFFLFALICGCTLNAPATGPLFTEIIPNTEGYATLYIYRPYHEVGRFVWPEVFFNDTKVVGLKNQGYTVVHLKPGKYQIRTEKNSFFSGMDNIPGEIEINNEATYYLALAISYTKHMDPTFVGFPLFVYKLPRYELDYEKWQLVKEEYALERLKQCRYVKPYVDLISP